MDQLKEIFITLIFFLHYKRLDSKMSNMIDIDIMNKERE